MKPDWKDAPEWANWLAMDASGSWWWYEYKPRICRSVFDMSKDHGKYESVSFKKWKDSLEKRPESS